MEGAALRRLVRARGRELRMVRRLAQAVLRQRSDVETFLVAALQQASCLEFPHTWYAHMTIGVYSTPAQRLSTSPGKGTTLPYPTPGGCQ